MNEEQEMIEFVQWLPQNIQQFSDVLPEEIIVPIQQAKDENEVVTILNELSKNEEGQQIVGTLFTQFEKSKQSQMFKKGGKLAFGLEKFQRGGSNFRYQLTPEEIDARPWRYEKAYPSLYSTEEISTHTGWNKEDNGRWGPVEKHRIIEFDPVTNTSDTTYSVKYIDMPTRYRVGVSTRMKKPKMLRWLFRKVDNDTVKFWNDLEKNNQ